ncbi:MAG: sigma 54-interacting transcriptional regulator [Archangium sp.]
MHSTLTEGFDSSSDGGKRSAFLFRVFDADRPTASSARIALHAFDEVLFGRADAHRADTAITRVCKLGVADRWMSGQHARLSRVLKSWVIEDTKSKNGVRVNGALIQRAELQDGDVIELGRTFFVLRVDQPWAADVTSDAVPTLSPSLAEKFDELAKLAKSNVTVAITGPTGSGKEVLAKTLHQLSARSGPFVAVNCGALPDELVESELFGNKKGAFSGAIEERKGLVRAAHGGTLLLDEVGDLPLETQPALLRVLQERVVVPVGGTTPLPVDVRVISATHRSLEQLVGQGAFRDDLRARLGGYEIALPALEARREDLGLLIAALTKRLSPQRAPTVQFSIAAARALFAWDWPRNVRELEKVLDRALVLSGSGPIEPEHLPPELLKPPPKRSSDADPDDVDDGRKTELENLLRQHNGNVSAVARAMGKARMQIQRWLKRYQLDPRDFGD